MTTGGKGLEIDVAHGVVVSEAIENSLVAHFTGGDLQESASPVRRTFHGASREALLSHERGFDPQLGGVAGVQWFRRVTAPEILRRRYGEDESGDADRIAHALRVEPHQFRSGHCAAAGARRAGGQVSGRQVMGMDRPRKPIGYLVARHQCSEQRFAAGVRPLRHGERGRNDDARMVVAEAPAVLQLEDFGEGAVDQGGGRWRYLAPRPENRCNGFGFETRARSQRAGAERGRRSSEDRADAVEKAELRLDDHIRRDPLKRKLRTELREFRGVARRLTARGAAGFRHLGRHGRIAVHCCFSVCCTLPCSAVSPTSQVACESQAMPTDSPTSMVPASPLFCTFAVTVWPLRKVTSTRETSPT